ncbi:flagellar hook assembly protein FlgD [Methylocucumis oryzae]|uniref:Basal-body rod modification protein FlgD n=1 Tax=Methylocucumis oryzae TaxID=1632867 RepID=A0A0F3IK15_9GAMM|nr:flagellar hook assembly protein FlgD [Methylocucumis oryzae]KJV07085.1 hypothetical protein VZ94_07105 [Methylocucumis oryzae]
MSSVSGLNGLGISSTQDSSSSNKSTTIDQQAFLKLLTTQMTHQDPTSPMKNSELTSQLAEISTASGVGDLKQSMQNLGDSLSSNQALQAASLVGRNVTVASDVGLLAAGGEINGSFNLSSSSDVVTLTISDPDTGDVIRKIELGQKEAGTVGFSWDGKNDAGTLVSPGLYKVQAEALIGGVNTAFQPEIETKVESVSLSSSGNAIQVSLAGLGSMSVNKIKQIL